MAVLPDVAVHIAQVGEAVGWVEHEVSPVAAVSDGHLQAFGHDAVGYVKFVISGEIGNAVADYDRPAVGVADAIATPYRFPQTGVLLVVAVTHRDLILRFRAGALLALHHVGAGAVGRGAAARGPVVLPGEGAVVTAPGGERNQIARASRARIGIDAGRRRRTPAAPAS